MVKFVIPSIGNFHGVISLVENVAACRSRLNAKKHDEGCVSFRALDSPVAFTRVVLFVVTRRAQVERADLSSTPDVTKRYYTQRVGTRVKSGVNARKFCPAGPEHVRHSVTVFVGAREAGASAHKNYVSSYDLYGWSEPRRVIYFLRFVRGHHPIMRWSSAGREGDKLYFPKSSDAPPRIPGPAVTIVITRSS